jgi:hypothetical protein
MVLVLDLFLKFHTSMVLVLGLSFRFHISLALILDFLQWFWYQVLILESKTDFWLVYWDWYSLGMKPVLPQVLNKLVLVWGWDNLMSLQSMCWYKVDIASGHTNLVSSLRPNILSLIYISGFQYSVHPTLVQTQFHNT